MKKIYLTLIIILSVFQFTYAQWTQTTGTTLTTLNSIGIGTTTPTLGKLEIDGTFDFLSFNSSSTTEPVQLNAYNNVDFRLIQRSNAIMTLWTNTIERMRIDQNGNVGIGTTAPSAKLQIATTSDVNPTNIGATNFDSRHFAIGTNGVNASALAFSKNSTTGGSAFISSATIGLSWDPLGFQAGTYNWYLGGKSTPSMIITSSGNLLIGEPSQKNASYILDVGGTERANGIVVNATGADFVFEPTYKLYSLPALKEYIDQNHHLPEIPSSKDMQKDGLNVGENQVKLLQKVEELTLYLIEKDKVEKEQQSQIDIQTGQLTAANSKYDEANAQLKTQGEQIKELQAALAKLIGSQNRNQ